MEVTTDQDFTNIQENLYWEKEDVTDSVTKPGPQIIIKNVSNTQYRNNR